MTIFKNFTPHEINVSSYNDETDSNEMISFPSIGIARVGVTEKHEDHARIDSNTNIVYMYSETFGQVEGLPDAENDTIYIVSRMVYDASDRNDIVYPIGLIRDQQGKIVGCKGFSITKVSIPHR
jgi:hypothetical protein